MKLYMTIRVANLLGLALTLSLLGFGGDYQFKAEDKYFGKNRTNATALIKKFYAEGQILLLGAANHRNVQHHLDLIDLLKDVGSDPKLRYLVLEQSHDNSEFYEKLSTTPIDEVLKTHAFPSDHARMLTLCWSREWSYVYTHVFPIVQQINKSRPMGNPLRVLAIDGFSTSSAYGLHREEPVTSEGCTFSEPERHNNMADVQNREIATAENFNEQVWQKIQHGEKIIVLYHQNHLYKHFQSCRIMRTARGPISTIAARTWYSLFLAAHPEAERVTRSILFDEVDEAYHPDGVLRFTKRQSERYPGQAWAIDVRGMHGIDVEKGENGWIFGPTAYDNEGMNWSDKYFYEIADGVIYSPRAHVDHHLGSVTDYLPQACSESYDGNSLLPADKKNP
jgi:hypothetical protein